MRFSFFHFFHRSKFLFVLRQKLDDINLPTTPHISLYLRVVNASDNGRAKIMSIEPSVSQYSYRYPMTVKGVTRGSKSTRGGRGSGRRGGRGGRGARMARKAAMEKGRWWLVSCTNGVDTVRAWFNDRSTLCQPVAFEYVLCVFREDCCVVWGCGTDVSCI